MKSGNPEYAPTPKGGKLVSKVEKFDWEPIPDKPGELAYVSKWKILVDKTYQREDSVTKVRNIARAFSWMAFGALLVARRDDGSLWVYDGQHRLEGAKSRTDVSEVPCIIHEARSLIEEAKGFWVVNTQVGAMPAYAKHRALTVAQEPIALAINEMLDRYGYAVTRDSKAERGVMAVAALRRALEADADTAEEVVRALAFIAGEESTAQLPAHLISGMFRLRRAVASQENVFSPANLEKFRVKGIDGLSVACRQQGAKEGGQGGDAVWARGLLEVLNAYRRRRLKWPTGVSES